jgi:hypothetical protein
MSKIGDAEDIFSEAQSSIECVRLAACQLKEGEESDAIAAVAMAAYRKIGEGIALLDECHEAGDASPVPAAPSAMPASRAPRTKRKGK